MLPPDKHPPRYALPIAWSVHLFPASGAAFAFLALEAALARDFVSMYVWLGVAFFIDGIDGSLARLAQVKRNAAHVDGDLLDLVVDYLTYVLVPMVALWRAQTMPDVVAQAVVMIVLTASALYFADTRMKTQDQWFRGFPTLWNVVVLYLFVFKPGAVIVVAVVLVLTAAMFVPIVFVHPLRVRRLRQITIAVTILWFVSAALAVADNFAPNGLVQAGLIVSAVYVLALPLARHSPWVKSSPGG